MEVGFKKIMTPVKYIQSRRMRPPLPRCQNERLPICELDLKAATLPIILDALDKYGLPAPVRELHSAQRRQEATATLALVMADIAARLVEYYTSPTGQYFREQELRLRLGPRSLRTELRDCNEELYRLSKGFLGDSEMIRLPATSISPNEWFASLRISGENRPERTSKIELETVMVRNLNGIFSTPGQPAQSKRMKRITWLKKRIVEICGLQDKNEGFAVEFHRLKDASTALGRASRSRAERRRLRILFDSDSPVGHDDIRKELYENHARWWDQVTKFVERQVEKKTRRFQFLGRDYDLRRAVLGLVKSGRWGESSQAAAIRKVWGDARAFGSNLPSIDHPVSDRQIIRWRYILAALDEKSIQWLEDLNQGGHPMAFYSKSRSKKKWEDILRVNDMEPELLKILRRVGEA